MITIREAPLADGVLVSQQIPEFLDPYPLETYEEKMAADGIMLVAYDGDKPVGFKAGYDRDKDGSFYTWMGGVLPGYREQGIAKQLAQKQEELVRAKGYKVIKLKTRNNRKNMLHFALKYGFQITGVEPKEKLEDYRILLQKQL